MIISSLLYALYYQQQSDRQLPLILIYFLERKTLSVKTSTNNRRFSILCTLLTAALLNHQIFSDKFLLFYFFLFNTLLFFLAFSLFLIFLRMVLLLYEILPRTFSFSLLLSFLSDSKDSKSTIKKKRRVGFVEKSLVALNIKGLGKGIIFY